MYSLETIKYVFTLSTKLYFIRIAKKVIFYLSILLYNHENYNFLFNRKSFKYDIISKIKNHKIDIMF